MKLGSAFLRVFGHVMPTPSRIAASLVLTAGLVSARVEAADFGFSVTALPNPVVVSNTVVYSIDLTNTSGMALTAVQVTNAVSGPALFDGATNHLFSLNPLANPITTNNNAVIFQIDSMTNGETVHLTLGLSPLQVGFFTNAITVAATNVAGFSTNVVVDVIRANADLGVTITGPASGVLVNDLVTYRLTVTNLGPDAAPNVFLSNSLPADLQSVSVNPTNQMPPVTSNSLVFSLGTLASGGATNLFVTVQPTNAGLHVFSARVEAANVLDPNAANNTASLDLNVQTSLPGDLTVSIVSTQSFNPQTGLMEQIIRLTNVGTNDVAAARIVVSGLTNHLFNAVGTNGVNPFVVYAAPLATNQSVDLLLEYFVPSRLPVPDPTLTGLAISAVDLTPPSGTPVHIARLVMLPPRGAFPEFRVLIEFPAATNQTYLVLYSDDAGFTHAQMAQPAVVAPADRVQWIDYGPPKTTSRPAHASARFYRVVVSPNP